MAKVGWSQVLGHPNEVKLKFDWVKTNNTGWMDG